MIASSWAPSFQLIWIHLMVHIFMVWTTKCTWTLLYVFSWKFDPIDIGRLLFDEVSILVFIAAKTMNSQYFLLFFISVAAIRWMHSLSIDCISDWLENGIDRSFKSILIKMDHFEEKTTEKPDISVSGTIRIWLCPQTDERVAGVTVTALGANILWVCSNSKFTKSQLQPCYSGYGYIRLHCWCNSVEQLCAGNFSKFALNLRQ